MTRPAVYLETSVIDYATSPPSRNLVVARHQQITRECIANADVDAMNAKMQGETIESLQ